jgi:hypothetical protein
VEYAIEMPDDGAFDVIVTTTGRATPQGLVECRRSVITDPRTRPEMNVMFDHTKLDMAGLSTADVQGMAASAARTYLQGGARGYVAIVAPALLTFGLARMFQGFAGEAVREHSTVVRTADEAQEWLAARTA